MNLDVLALLLQTALLLGLAPLLSGCIKNWKAKLQNRRGPRVWQPYFDVLKFLRKRYGGGQWRKLKGIAKVRKRSGSMRWAEVHWYEAHGIGRKGWKIKRFLD